MENNKKGFTLIELLAVIVVLAILMLTAGTSVFNLITDARKNNFKNEYLSLIEAASLQAQMDMMNSGTLGTGNTGSKCYYLSGQGKTAGSAIDKTRSLDSRWDNKGDYYGSVKAEQTADGKLTFTAWLYSAQFAIENKTDETVQSSDVKLIADASVGTGNTGSGNSAIPKRMNCGV